jgi:hypothetical protein
MQHRHVFSLPLNEGCVFSHVVKDYLGKVNDGPLKGSESSSRHVPSPWIVLTETF